MLSLIFGYVSLVESGRRLEHGLGSSAFGTMLLTLTVLTNAPYLLLTLSLSLITGSQRLLSNSAAGVWTMLLSVIALECSAAPSDHARRILNLDVRTRNYPLLLLGIFSLFGGFQLQYVLGVAVGYAYGLGYCDRLKVGQQRLTAWENGVLANFATRRGWVVGHAASGSTSWILPTRSNTAGSGGDSSSDDTNSGGGWSPAAFFGGTAQTGSSGNAADGSRDGSSAPEFPSGGRMLGGGSSGGIDGAVRRTAPRTDEARHAAIVAAAERRAARQQQQQQHRQQIADNNNAEDGVDSGSKNRPGIIDDV